MNSKLKDVTTEKRWQFWIDVGGTFTDCVARSPEGMLYTHKTLSSGRIKGSGKAVDAFMLRDPQRIGDPNRFWTGWRIAFLNSAGQVTGESQVVDFDSTNGTLTIADQQPVVVDEETLYELYTGLEAPIVCIRAILELRLDESIPPIDVRMGTTRGTNALLERKGTKTAFITTQGFADLLEIGNQSRPDLFDLDIKKTRPLYDSVVEFEERIDASGAVRIRLDTTKVREQLAILKNGGMESLAIAFLHAYRNPAHEELVETIARDMGFAEVSRSSTTAPTIKIIPRAETTVLDAYLTPILRSYVASIRDAMSPDSSLKLMTSHGGLVDGENFTGKDSILSGPAGGVVAFSQIGNETGFAQSIGFDMGGTSTDVARFGGEFEIQTDTIKAGVSIASPTLAIETVAAGGGSICYFDGVQLCVGPESAGADPGPACYGRGGPLTVTDANVALGRVPTNQFPFPIDQAAVEDRLQAICQQIEFGTGKIYTTAELAQGFVNIANETMARAIRTVSIQKGYHPHDHLLISFGGAGGQHACAMASRLGMQKILIHPFSGILSAYGMGLADVRKREEVSVLQPFSPPSLDDLIPQSDIIAKRLQAAVQAEGISAENVLPPEISLAMRYQGVESNIVIHEPDDGDWAEAYEQQHEHLFGYRHQNRPIEIVSLIVEVVGKTTHSTGLECMTQSEPVTPDDFQTVYFQNEQHKTPVYLRSDLGAGAVVTGPAIVCDAGATIWIEPHFEGVVQKDGSLLLSQQKVENRPAERLHQASTDEPDLILLEVFNNQFASIAEQMGVVLQKTSVSTNVKERLDYSCAIFDAAGKLVVNAPHIPVHLGAMGETVRTAQKLFPEMRRGDVYITNDPYAGGSHLPDVTVITPVFADQSEELLFLTASRAHHAEIGGITPGSMPPFSTNLAEEGVLIRPFKLVDRGISQEQALRVLLTSGPFPSRNVADNLADISAQVAANQAGANLLTDLCRTHGQALVLNYMQHIQTAARTKMQRALANLADGVYRRIDYLDDGTPVCVEVMINGDRAVVDFDGTGPVLRSNLNANRGIVTAAVMYVFRCLIDESIPLNAGVLDPIEIVLPECLLNPPSHAEPAQCAAMVGGNVETSQRVVDVLLGALGVAAASQGTMNNLTFGDDSFGYYETICGGAGATPDAAGASAVHTHMTNTRLTDVEVIEHRYPVFVKEFKRRPGSGGIGLHNGGDGIVRTFEFLKPLKVSLLTQRRGEFPPFGLAGGAPGKIGHNQLCQAGSDRWEEIGGSTHKEVLPGTQLKISTPGGGGYGEHKSDGSED